MKFSTMTRFGLLAPLALTVAACGGGMGGGSGGDYRNVSPVAGLSMNDIEASTGAKARQTKAMSSTVATGYNYANPLSRFVKGAITFADSQLLDNGDTRDPDVHFDIDMDQDGDIVIGQDEKDQRWSSNFNPENNPIRDETGEYLIQKSITTIGGEQIIVTGEVPDAQSITVLYMPASAAEKMYAGMINHTDTYLGGAGGSTGIFGIETTSDELAAQSGQAEYAGIATATVSRQVGPSGGEPGHYNGWATGTVNFDSRSVTAQTTLGRARTLPGYSGTDTITVNASGSFNANGKISGAASYGDLVDGKVVSGTIDGNLFGPNAETLGVTFIGNDADTSSRIAGGMLLNRTDD